MPSDPSRWIGRTPDEWKTGHEPMTNPQSGYLLDMSNKNRIDIPFVTRTDANGQKVTKAEASILLTKFERREPVDAFFIDGLGRGAPVSQPGHPLTWNNCHEPPTEWQVKWVDQLTEDLGIAGEVTHKGTLGITLGQASMLITLLRAEKGVVPRRKQTAQWLDDAVTASIEQVPLPDEGEGIDRDYEPDEDEEEDGEESGEDEDEMDVDMNEGLGRTELRELLADAQPELMQFT